MAFDWIEYLHLAEELAQRAANPAHREARWRSAISRAYYAAFIKARNLLRDREGLVIPRAATHQFVIARFVNSPDRRRSNLGWELNVLFADRKKADYEDQVAGLSKLANDSLKRARWIITQLDQV